MSIPDMYRKMVNDYVTECWIKYHTVEDVRNAIDKFMADMPTIERSKY